VIALFVALCKRAIEQSLAHLLFKKERMKDCSFHCSLQKSEQTNALFVALFKRANV